MDRDKRDAVRLLCVALVVLFCSLLVGCGRGQASASDEDLQVAETAAEPATIRRPDRTVITIPPGGRYKARSAHAVQPSRPDGPAQAKLSDDGAGATTADATTPGSDNPSAVLADMWWLQAVGVILVIAGGVLVLMRRAGMANPVHRVIMSNVPKGSGFFVAGLGGALIVLPYFLERYGWVLLVVALGAIGWVLWRWYTKTQQRVEQPS